ncbi:MAG: hypothetical protein H6760_01865 [Candidatus Nomurabacteria bacterium]|nr:MAG: hypothetical protein H6760_01865 [Candidatus Nomurabacteria bacterium]
MSKSLLRTTLLSIGLLSIIALTGQSCTIFGPSKQADGGAFRSDDQGQTWEQKAIIGTVDKKLVTIEKANGGIFVFHPSDPDTIYYGTRGNGLYRTEDAGERWQVTGRQDGNVIALAIDPEEPEVLYAGYGPHIEKSFDGGITWDRVYTESREQLVITSIVIEPNNADHIYASNTGGVILESLDRGQTWHVLHIFQSAVNQLYMHPNDATILMAIVDKKYLQRSGDAGLTWTPLQENLMQFNGANVVNALAFDTQQASRIYIATNYGLLRSNDLGSNWEAMQTLVPNNTLVIRTVHVDPRNSNNIFFTTENKLHISKDAGATWEVVTIPTSRLVTVYAIHPQRPDQHFIGTLFVEK